MSRGYIMRNAVMPITIPPQNETTLTYCLLVDKKSLKAIRRLHHLCVEYDMLCLDLLYMFACLTVMTVSSHFMVVFGNQIADNRRTTTSTAILFFGLLGPLCGLLGPLSGLLVVCRRIYAKEKNNCCLVTIGLIMVCCFGASIFYISIFIQRINLSDNMVDIPKNMPSKYPLKMIK